jgi:hypothetical protein
MRLAEGIAKRKGGKWQEYFSLENSATLEDADKVLRILQTAGKYQVVLIDDCSLAISNRSWNSPQNRNFNALLSICRTNRWILLLTAPLKSHVDNQVREMCDITMTIYRSYHAGKFNVCKITSSETSTGPKQKEYIKRLSFHKKKVDAWVSFKPPKELTDKYDRDRDAAALELNTRIVQTGSFKGTGTKTSTEPKVPLSTKHLQEQVALHGDRVKMFLRENPSMSINKLSAKLGLQHQPTQRIVEHLGLTIQPKVKKVAKE